MLDASVVLNKNGSSRGGVLSPASPDCIIDGGTAGATVTFGPARAPATATIDNTYTPGTYAAATNPFERGGDTRRVLKMGGSDHVPFSVSFA